MRDIDIYNWNRKAYYEYYMLFDNPCFSINVNIDITTLIAKIKKDNLKFFPTLLFCVMVAINEIDEFKYRIRGKNVVIHDIIHPSFTVLNSKENYVFCYSEFQLQFHKFYQEVIENIKKAAKGSNLVDEEGRDDLVFISSVPWLEFTGVTHPFTKDEPHSIPKITWGKYFEDNKTIKLPFSVQVHHGLCDGLHIARLVEKINETINYL